jgi:hypothetical protein
VALTMRDSHTGHGGHHIVNCITELLGSWISGYMIRLAVGRADANVQMLLL